MGWYKRAKRKYKGEHEGATIFFTDGDQVLILKRSMGNYLEHWCLPGGHREEGETDIETAEREAIEEIGTIEGYLYSSHIKNGWRTLFYKIDEPFKPKLNKEHSEYEWVKLNDLENYKLVPYLDKEISKYRHIAEKAKTIF